MKTVLFFQDTELAQNAKQLGNLDRESYLSFLETDYYQRMVEEHKEEIGLFGRIEAPKFLDPQLMESTQEG